ncbi:MAG: hypothetical protein ACXWDN_09585 [Limisphaerales bacterium]
MVSFTIVMIAVALLAAVGFILANRQRTESPPDHFKQYVQSLKEQPREVTPDKPANEDIVTYLSTEIPALLQEILASVPLATTEEAVMGCYGTMGFAGAPHPTPGAKTVHPFQTGSLDELMTRTMTAIDAMENEQHISRFTISTQATSRTNPHVDLFAHSTEPKRIRLIRYWRTPNCYIANLPE